MRCHTSGQTLGCCVLGAVLFGGVGSIVSSSSAGSIPGCAAKAVAPTLGTNGASGRVIIYLGIRNTGRACLAEGSYAFALRDKRTGRALRVIGNPRLMQVRLKVRTGSNRVIELQWANYCGPGRPLFLEARFGIRVATETDNYPGARCDAKSQPSRLEVFT